MNDVAGPSFTIRCLQALDDDPLFEGARYLFSVEPEGGAGFEVRVQLSVYYVSLLTMARRRLLRDHARTLVERALAAGCRAAATVRVSADGIASWDGGVLGPLLPLTRPAPPPAPAPAH